MMLVILWITVSEAYITAQTVVGGSVPDSSAILDIQGTTRGVLFPHLTTAQRDAIAGPAEGLMLYNVTTKCLEINLGTPAAPGWMPITCAESTGGGDTCAINSMTDCWAKISATDTLYFMCHNLASANTSADPCTPSWEIIGGYWQWGRKGPDEAFWTNTNEYNFAHGPTGPNASEANDGAINTWSMTGAANGAWSDASKTADDPCPVGFRVPTKAQWDGVLANNTLYDIGTWSNNATNYSSGTSVGSNLFLPATGFRDSFDGTLFDRGSISYYWSSTERPESELEEGDDPSAWGPNFGSGGFSEMFDYNRLYGHSVRCAAE